VDHVWRYLGHTLLGQHCTMDIEQQHRILHLATVVAAFPRDFVRGDPALSGFFERDTR
jgi:hypothetical protein